MANGFSESISKESIVPINAFDVSPLSAMRKSYLIIRGHLLSAKEIQSLSEKALKTTNGK
jgi:hypothetical protein